MHRTGAKPPVVKCDGCPADLLFMHTEPDSSAVGENAGAAVASDASSSSASFPPPGWITTRQVAERMGVAYNSLQCTVWPWRNAVRAVGKVVARPGARGRVAIYPVVEIDRIIAERDASKRFDCPEGYVDKDGACAMFGVSHFVWKNWIRQKKVRCGTQTQATVGGRRTIYRVQDLERLRDELFGDDVLHKKRDGTYHVPSEYMTRDEAWETLGVGKGTWERWEREGKIVGGQRVPGGPKLYRTEDIFKLLEEYGKWCPPYPDPLREGVYRVPLSGRDIRRREAIVDADVVPLLEGASCSWSESDFGGFVNLHRPGDVEQTTLRRLVMGISDANENVRHVNGDPLDCRRENLVVRTIAQRVYNNRKRRLIAGRKPSSRFKGVHWVTRLQSWKACICKDGKRRGLGRYGDEIAAAMAYDEAARELFGEHAWLNFPDGVDAWLESEHKAEAEAETRVATQDDRVAA